MKMLEDTGVERQGLLAFAGEGPSKKRKKRERDKEAERNLSLEICPFPCGLWGLGIILGKVSTEEGRVSQICKSLLSVVPTASPDNDSYH